MKNVMKNVKAMVMVFAALVMIGAAGTAQASMYYNGDVNFPSVYSDGNNTYYIDTSSACYGSYDNSGATEFAAIFIEENANSGATHQSTYQFKDTSDCSYWSTSSMSSWIPIRNKAMWMCHNAAKNYAR